MNFAKIYKTEILLPYLTNIQSGTSDLCIGLKNPYTGSSDITAPFSCIPACFKSKPKTLNQSPGPHPPNFDDEHGYLSSQLWQETPLASSSKPGLGFDDLNLPGLAGTHHT